MFLLPVSVDKYQLIHVFFATLWTVITKIYYGNTDMNSTEEASRDLQLIENVSFSPCVILFYAIDLPWANRYSSQNSERNVCKMQGTLFLRKTSNVCCCSANNRFKPMWHSLCGSFIHHISAARLKRREATEVITSNNSVFLPIETFNLFNLWFQPRVYIHNGFNLQLND